MKHKKDFMPHHAHDEKVPSLWLRLAANMIDSVLLLVIAIPVMLPMIVIVVGQTVDALNSGAAEVIYTQNQQLIIGFTSLALLFVTIAYYTFTTSSRLSASVGKRLLGLRVIDLSGATPSRALSFKRYMFLAGLGMPYSLLGGAQNSVAAGVGVFFSVIQTIYLIVSAYYAQADPQKRMIHDKLSRTRVVFRRKDS